LSAIYPAKMKTYKEINEKIADKNCVVVTAEEMKEIAESLSPEKATKEVDVVTTGTFGARSRRRISQFWAFRSPYKDDESLAKWSSCILWSGCS